uniref:Rho-GAP domain-containing protein n=1 Tax=Anopheles farauti TaxID=69004 RepID=A0A182QFK3_9DIPT
MFSSWFDGVKKLLCCNKRRQNVSGNELRNMHTQGENSEESGHSKTVNNTQPSSVESSSLLPSNEPVGFDCMLKQRSPSAADQWQPQPNREPCVDLEELSVGEQRLLQPLLWLELESLFSKNEIQMEKRKPDNRMRKEQRRVFGVTLNALVRRDLPVTGEDTTLVPLLLQTILAELTERGLLEEGLLRKAGQKQKVSNHCCMD